MKDAKKKETRREIELDLDKYEASEGEGCTIYLDPSGSDQPAGSVSCCACGAKFRMSAREYIVVCGCNTLYRYEPEYDGQIKKYRPNHTAYPSLGKEK
jgi:hypothetical protein